MNILVCYHIIILREYRKYNFIRIWFLDYLYIMYNQYYIFRLVFYPIIINVNNITCTRCLVIILFLPRVQYFIPTKSRTKSIPTLLFILIIYILYYTIIHVDHVDLSIDVVAGK